MVSLAVEGQRNRRRPRSGQDKAKNHRGKSATAVVLLSTSTRSFTTTIGCFRILLVLALVLFERDHVVTCLVLKNGGYQYYCDSTHHHHRLSNNNNRSRFLFENSNKGSNHRDFSWSLPASVRGLFEVLDEESNNFDKSDDDDDDDVDVDVSDAEALLACWSFLKRRKRLGEWKEYEERKSQRLLSQNYFLTDDEEVDSLPAEDDEDDYEDDERETNQNLLLLEDEDKDLGFETIDKDDIPASMATVEDILLASSVPIDDNFGLGGGGDTDDEDGVAQDLITISDFVSKATTNGPITNDDGGVVPKRSEKEDIDLWHTEFTSFPKEPNPSRTRRVETMKRRWEDPEYRKRWYEKRWGSKSSRHRNEKDTTTQQTDRERQAVQRARALPSGFLGSEELASMTEDEIAQAIRTRIESTRKQVASRKATLQGRRDLLARQIESLEALSEEDNTGNDDSEEEDDEESIRQVLFSPTKERLKEAQRKRSEWAKKLYATRVENQKRRGGTKTNQSAEDDPSSASASESASTTTTTTETKSVRTKGPYFPPKQPTPRDAFLRIENDLDHGLNPSVDDVRLVLQPGKMKDRKLLLCRILEERFHLKGKCVPPISEEENRRIEEGFDASSSCDVQDLAFVKQCTIARLGNFVVRLLKTEES